jgi:hypothetical protein
VQLRDKAKRALLMHHFQAAKLLLDEALDLHPTSHKVRALMPWGIMHPRPVASA